MADKTLWVSQISDYHSTDREGVGRIRQIGSRFYRYLRNSTGGALTANRLYYFGAVATSGYSYGQEVFTLGQSSKSTSINQAAGVAQSAIPDGNFGWFQFEGPSTLGVEGTSAVAIGDNLKGVSGQVYAVKDTAAGTAPTNTKTAIALAAQAVASVVEIAVDLHMR